SRKPRTTRRKARAEADRSRRRSKRQPRQFTDLCGVLRSDEAPIGKERAGHRRLRRTYAAVSPNNISTRLLPRLSLMSVKMSPELRKLLDTIDLDANNKAEYLRKAVAEGVSLDTAYIALTLNIAEGNEK